MLSTLKLNFFFLKCHLEYVPTHRGVISTFQSAYIFFLLSTFIGHTFACPTCISLFVLSLYQWLTYLLKQKVMNTTTQIGPTIKSTLNIAAMHLLQQFFSYILNSLAQLLISIDLCQISDQLRLLTLTKTFIWFN